MKLRRSTIIPFILLVYLAVMAVMGLKGLRTGQMDLWQYVATIVVTLGIIYLLRKFLQRREQKRK